MIVISIIIVAQKQSWRKLDDNANDVNLTINNPVPEVGIKTENLYFEYNPTLSNRIVSSVSREINGKNYIQITAPISHGNSGGPLFDQYGNIIGITSAATYEGQNINLAIPIVQVSKVNRNKSFDMTHFYDAEKPDQPDFEYIKPMVLFFGIDSGPHKGEVHTRSCPVVKNQLDEWIFNQQPDGNITIFLVLMMLFLLVIKMSVIALNSESYLFCILRQITS